MEMIIDTDCGVDDAMAILQAFHSKWNVSAITTCRGNTTAGNAANNVMRLTNACHKTNIPVYVGCNLPLVDIDLESLLTTFHGEDGFGGVAHLFPVGEQSVETEHAVTRLVKMVSEKPKQITLVALGPLTNLAMAQRLDENFGSNLKEVMIMGGNVIGIGNTTAGAEFNFKVDPEAAYTVLKEFTCPIKIFPWEACLQSLLPWDWYDEWISQPTPIGKLIGSLTSETCTRNRAEVYPAGIQIPDLQALSSLIYPELVTESLNFPVTVELNGVNSRGMMIVDRRTAHRIDYQHERSNKTVITKLNVQLLKEVLMPVTADNWTEVSK